MIWSPRLTWHPISYSQLFVSSRVGIFLHFFNHILWMSHDYDACVHARTDVRLVSSTLLLLHGSTVSFSYRTCTCVCMRVCAEWLPFATDDCVNMAGTISHFCPPACVLGMYPSCTLITESIDHKLVSLYSTSCGVYV